MSTQKRRYELKERRRRQAETRRRIVEATVSLHEEQGPAATTIAEIARRAGVSRLTVYNHFPTDGELFAACQERFLAETPPPDLSSALALADPQERLREVLAALYRSYRRQAPMAGKVLRDRERLPALDALLAQTVDASQAELAETLASGFAPGRRAARRTRAVIALALDFFTWQRLTREGLGDDGAATLMAELVAASAAAG